MLRAGLSRQNWSGRTLELSHRPDDMSRPKTKRQTTKRGPVGSSEIVLPTAFERMEQMRAMKTL